MATTIGHIPTIPAACRFVWESYQTAYSVAQATFSPKNIRLVKLERARDPDAFEEVKCEYKLVESKHTADSPGDYDPVRLPVWLRFAAAWLLIFLTRVHVQWAPHDAFVATVTLTPNE